MDGAGEGMAVLWWPLLMLLLTVDPGEGGETVKTTRGIEREVRLCHDVSVPTIAIPSRSDEYTISTEARDANLGVADESSEPKQSSSSPRIWSGRSTVESKEEEEEGGLKKKWGIRPPSRMLHGAERNAPVLSPCP